MNVRPDRVRKAQDRQQQVQCYLLLLISIERRLSHILASLKHSCWGDHTARHCQRRKQNHVVSNCYLKSKATNKMGITTSYTNILLRTEFILPAIDNT